MSRTLAAWLLLPLLLVTGACGSSETTPADPDPAASTAATGPADDGPTSDRSTSDSGATGQGGDAGTTGSGGDTGAAGDAVAQYCADVDALITQLRSLMEEPDPLKTAEVAGRLQELASQAGSLLDEAANDPAVGERVRKCAAKLENLTNPELPN